MICNPSYKKGSTYQTRGFAIPPVGNDLHFRLAGYVVHHPTPAISHPARRPDGFAIRRIKRFDLSNLGICNPPTP